MIKLTLNALDSLTLGDGIENLDRHGAAISPYGYGLTHIVSAYDANQTIVGTPGDDTLTGGSGDDTIYGLAGNDSIDGGAGADTLVGGAGNDHYFVDRQDDVIYENAGEGTDLVTTTANYYLYANIENLTLATGAGDIFGVGNDLANTINGNEGANVLLGGAGNDTIHGNAGNDQVYGEAGNDTVYGEAGVDYLIGGDGDDVLDGGIDEDGIYGQDGNDTLWGGTDFKTDTLVGGNGDDVIHADSGKGDYDLLDGGAGNDTYYVDTYADATYEAAGGGMDTVYANISGSGYYLYANVEKLVLLGDTAFGVGNELDNVLIGSDSANTLLGGDGRDFIFSGGGNDTIYGQGGQDVLDGEAGDDVISGGDGGDDILGHAGNDIIYGDDGDDIIDSGQGQDVVSGGAGNDTIHSGPDRGDTIYGDDGNDVIYTTGSYSNVVSGGAGDDVMHAGSGFDSLYGGIGDDSYYVGILALDVGTDHAHDTVDTVFEDANAGTDTVYVSGGGNTYLSFYYMTANVENLVLTSEIGGAVGNELDNVMTGSDTVPGDTLMGGAGNDVLNGKLFDDTLWGNAGSDRFVFERGTGKDTVADFTPGTDKIDISFLHLSTFADVVPLMHESGGNTIIDLGSGDTITLTGVAESSLHEGDFVLSGGSSASVPMAQLVHTQAANDADFTEARSALIHLFDAPHISVDFGAM